jgi:hypothetical protein
VQRTTTKTKSLVVLDAVRGRSFSLSEHGRIIRLDGPGGQVKLLHPWLGQLRVTSHANVPRVADGAQLTASMVANARTSQ